MSGVIFYMDAGVRPAVLGMAQRLADDGEVTWHCQASSNPKVPTARCARQVFEGGWRAIPDHQIYIAAAQNDGSHPLEIAERLKEALAQAGLRYNLET